MSFWHFHLSYANVFSSISSEILLLWEYCLHNFLLHLRNQGVLANHFNIYFFILGHPSHMHVTLKTSRCPFGYNGRYHLALDQTLKNLLYYRSLLQYLLWIFWSPTIIPGKIGNQSPHRILRKGSPKTISRPPPLSGQSAGTNRSDLLPEDPLMENRKTWVLRNHFRCVFFCSF